MSKYDAAIDKGIELLDAQVPNWCKQMQLDHLDLADVNSCVLGQVYGHFGHGLNALNMHGGSDLYGFIAKDGRDAVYLTRRWKQRIRQHCEAHS